jgi:hypothetical protein
MDDPHLHHLLSKAFSETIALMIGEQVLPIAPVAIPDNVLWSWVRIIDPIPSTLVIGVDPAMASGLATLCLGEDSATPRTMDEINDAQAELTNVVAGRFAQEMFNENRILSLGTPRTGRGVPNLDDGDWTACHFRLGACWAAAFINGKNFPRTMPRPGTGPIAQQPAAAPSSARNTPDLLQPSTVNVPPLPHADPNDVPPDRHFTPLQRKRILTPAGILVQIGNYRIIDQLGEGGMGMVYKAHHDVLNRLVALKVMREDLARDEDFIARFQHEGHAAAAIDHPNVVPVYDAGIADGQLYMAMRFVPGGDLATLLNRSGRLAEERALHLTQHCLLGLQAISEAGMIHRDIKPANILLEPNGVPRLADLGLARSLMSAKISRTGAPQGTPTFMAPEQAKALPDVDIRCDIYALGVTLYCMLTGQPPYLGESPYDVVANVLYQPVPDPRAIRPEISTACAQMIMTAMAKKREDRFQTPEEFLRKVVGLQQRLRNPGSGPNLLSGPRTTSNYWLRKIFGDKPGK